MWAETAASRYRAASKICGIGLEMHRRRVSATEVLLKRSALGRKRTLDLLRRRDGKNTGCPPSVRCPYDSLIHQEPSCLRGLVRRADGEDYGDENLRDISMQHRHLQFVVTRLQFPCALIQGFKSFQRCLTSPYWRATCDP